ncbi:MAG TPA: molybdenum cofactor biosynthesis protein MoaE [Acidimicrobiales bacterium]|jgi:molybdopterin synthase catalytic subunit|nr:molybdenum cofactor biosynthesis protein MoaE [Acidimicrobiales bacterium]
MAASDTWARLTDEPLAVGALAEWVVRPDCGAVVVFTGTVRDHADGRPDVTSLEYEAYAEEVEPRLEALAEEARRRWPALGRVALHHRTGTLSPGEPSVVVAVSTPHRAEAFEAAHWCIDRLKASVPIWKRETWAGGEGWGLDATEIEDVSAAEGAQP